jgi:ribosomal protein L40E
MPMRAEEIQARIKDSLPENEEIREFIPEIVADGKFYSLAVTANRLVMCKKRFAKLSNEDYPATRLDKISVEEGWLKSSLHLKLKDGTELKLERLKKDDARRVAGLIRTMISIAELGPNTVKICPDCGAQLKIISKVCPYCEYKFDTKA